MLQQPSSFYEEREMLSSHLFKSRGLSANYGSVCRRVTAGSQLA